MIEYPRPAAASHSLTRAAVLVSGASFAGLATAYWMDRLGYQVTLIEVGRGLRRGGTPVDVEGAALGVLSRMGLINAVRAKALPPRRFEFKDADNTTLGRMESQSGPDDAPEKYEIHRDDLLDILFATVEGSVEVVFGRTISLLEEKLDRVAVTFGDGCRKDYALVFGCDGNRSNTRRLAFGDADDFSYFMGAYFIMRVVPTTGMLPANVSEIYSQPGRTAFLNGYDDRTDVALAFRCEHEIEYDYRDRAAQRAMIHAHFDGLAWKVPVALDHIDSADDFYFDKVNQIRMPVWSKGRVALVGDAGYCVSPVAGMGGSLALIGAAGLADALQRHGTDHAAAFEEYHDKLHCFVEEVQDKAVEVGMAMMFPSDDAELAARDRKLGEGSIAL